MIEDVPDRVHIVVGAGDVLTEVSLANCALILRVFETAEDASRAAAFASQIAGEANTSCVPLADVLKSARTHDKAVQVILSRYDGLGQLVEVEVIYDPTTPIH
jgi:NAD(P)H-hydrate repair Nnr-like enzyme with NAD(P)H-hydrate dehydratase domain